MLSLKTNAQHVHIVDDTESNHPIGEADFHGLKVYFSRFEIISIEEAEKQIEENFEWAFACDHYYGQRDIGLKSTVYNLHKLIDHFLFGDEWKE